MIVSLPNESAPTSISALFYHRTTNTHHLSRFRDELSDAGLRRTAAALRELQRSFSRRYGAAARVPPIVAYDMCNKTHPFSPDELLPADPPLP